MQPISTAQITCTLPIVFTKSMFNLTSTDEPIIEGEQKVNKILKSEYQRSHVLLSESFLFFMKIGPSKRDHIVFKIIVDWVFLE